jgi:Flp pilus assembly protein TadD
VSGRLPARARVLACSDQLTGGRRLRLTGERRVRLVSGLVLAVLFACAEAEVKPTGEEAADAGGSEAQRAGEVPAPSEGVTAQNAPQAIAPEEKERGQKSFSAAQEALAAGDEARAIQLFTEAQQHDPQQTWAAIDAAVLLARQGKNAEAKATLRAALKARPDSAEASDNLVRLRLKLGEQREAESELAARIGLYPALLPLRVQYARVLISEGKLDGALAEAKRVLKADERNVAAMLVLGDVWYRERKFELARDVLETAAAVDPRNAETANAQGFVHLAMEQKPLAIEAFKRAVALNPGLAEARNNLGVLLTEASDFEGAAAQLQEAAKLVPDRGGIWLNLGNALRGARRSEEAESAYRRALALRPDDPNPLFNLAVLYLDGDFKQKTPVQRLEACQQFFTEFKKAGGSDAKLARWEAEADKNLKKERDRVQREERDKLKKAEAAKKAEDDKRRREAGKLGKIDEDPDAPAKPATSGKLGGKEDEK